MDARTVDIQRVVREVIARLDAQQNEAAGQKPQTDCRLVLSAKVISTVDLEGRLDGIKHLALQPGAIITPSARDLIQEHNVRVTYERSATSENNVGDAIITLAVGQDKKDFDPAALHKALKEDNIRTEKPKRKCLPGIATDLAQRVSNDRHFGIWITGQTAAAACLANRYKSVRAAVVADVRCAREAVDSIGANLLVIDPSGKSLFQLGEITRQLVCNGMPKCPDIFREGSN